MQRTGNQDTNGTDPGQPRNPSESLDTPEGESNNGGDRNEDGSAGAMARERIEIGRNTQDTRASDEDAEERKGDTEALVAEAAHDFLAHVIEAVDIGMSHFEDADDVAGPGCADGNGQQAEDAGNKAQGVEDLWDGKNTEADLRLEHQHDCALPADLRGVNELLAQGEMYRV